MRACSLLVWAALALAAQTTTPPQDPGPHYVQSSIVNAASPDAGPLAPNTLATIYGTRLARAERAVTEAEIRNGVLPTVLPNTYVRVMVGGLAAPLLYVSPNQINFLVPSELRPGNTEISVVLESRYGPGVRMRLAEASPALFRLDPEFVIAARPDGSVITPRDPARPGDIIVVYATGLGKTKPPVPSGQIATAAAWLDRIAEFSAWLNDTELPRESILYAGVAPGFAGLYQINLRLPESLPANPIMRIKLGALHSPADLRLPAAP